LTTAGIRFQDIYNSVFSGQALDNLNLEEQALKDLFVFAGKLNKITAEDFNTLITKTDDKKDAKVIKAEDMFNSALSKLSNSFRVGMGSNRYKLFLNTDVNDKANPRYYITMVEYINGNRVERDAFDLIKDGETNPNLVNDLLSAFENTNITFDINMSKLNIIREIKENGKIIYDKDNKNYVIKLLQSNILTTNLNSLNVSHINYVINQIDKNGKELKEKDADKKTDYNPFGQRMNDKTNAANPVSQDDLNKAKEAYINQLNKKPLSKEEQDLLSNPQVIDFKDR
jgi:hypothetical protein